MCKGRFINGISGPSGTSGGAVAYIVMACKFMAYMYVSGPSGTSGGAVPLLHASRMHHDGARVFGSGQCVVLAEQSYSSVAVAPALSTTCIVMTYIVMSSSVTVCTGLSK